MGGIGRDVAASLLALAAGGLVSTSLPPIGAWPLGVAGYGLLYASLAKRRPRWRLVAGLAAGVGQLGPSLWWTLAFTGPGWVALVVIGSLMNAAACLAVPRRPWRLAVFPAALTLAEAVRDSWPLGGLPIGGAALGQVLGLLSPVARVLGPLGLVAAAALAGAALAELALRRRVRDGAAALAVVGALTVLSALAPDGGPSRGQIEAAAVQGGGTMGLLATETTQDLTFPRLEAASDRIRPPVQLVLWPEDSVPVSGSPTLATAERLLAALARRFSATVVAGVTAPVGTTLFRNEAVAWSPSGAVVGTYEKVHRVPFGEYVPWRGVLSKVFNLSAVPRDAIPGNGPGILQTPSGRLGVLISFEDFFSSRSRAAVSAGAQVLLVPTNTASYGTSQIPDQELAASRLQAIESGRDLLQASTAGYSEIIDPDGRVERRSSLGVAAVVQGTLDERSGLTLYERWGDAPLLGLASAVTAVSLWRDGMDWRRRRGPESRAGSSLA